MSALERCPLYEVSVKKELTVLKTNGYCILSLESFCCFVFNVLGINAVTSPQRLLCCIKIGITWYCRMLLFSRQLFNFPNPHDHSIYTIKCSSVQCSALYNAIQYSPFFYYRQKYQRTPFHCHFYTTTQRNTLHWGPNSRKK